MMTVEGVESEKFKLFNALECNIVGQVYEIIFAAESSSLFFIARTAAYNNTILGFYKHFSTLSLSFSLPCQDALAVN